MDGYRKMIAACGRVTAYRLAGMAVSGTAYLIHPDLAATCEHVVRDIDPSSLAINFAGRRYAATVLWLDHDLDCAVLKLSEPVSGVKPFVLGGECSWKASFDCYGFPSIANGAGTTMSGIVSLPSARDDNGKAVLELTSFEVAAGMASPIHGFSGSPVLVNGIVVGHLKRILGDPNDQARAAFGKVYATPVSALHALLNCNMPQPLIPPQPGVAGHKRQKEKILDLVAAWTEQGISIETAGLLAAESLIQIGEPHDALAVLSLTPPSLRAKQLSSLAIAKTDIPEKLEEAIGMLEALQAEGHLDGETGGLLGGRYKQRWNASGRQKDLETCHATYRKAFELTADPYPGINAAATALWLDDRLLAAKIARKVLALLAIKPPGTATHWDMATEAELLLLTGETEMAKQRYREAAQRCGFARESVDIMRRQVAIHVAHLGLNLSDFATAFELT